ncbi:signal transduction histidine kinase [Chitinophaga dinghuensis]|uniref:histidine kinase n=1 Tax=Chitinophaga dinghuensis TaxID=1539050 RepID=A0A327W4F3_9BACT|nr:HAMP domain-containing sensor histidine kinase [Chitinophaga dinghuensis]RAJ83662.1 signal transduction histidine kinase [Chitinophaga dinghuensis]
MISKRLYPTWLKLPVRLTLEDYDAPFSVVESFINTVPLFEVRQNLEALYTRIKVSGISSQWESNGFRESFEKFLEATYVHYKQQKEPEQDPPYGILEFLATLGHEIKGQLAGIAMAIDSIQECWDADARVYKSSATAYFDIIRMSAFNALTVYHNLIKTSKIQRNQVNYRITPEQFPIVPFLKDCTLPFIPMSCVSGNTLELNTVIAEGTEGNADKAKLREIITNLVLNAIKFSHPNMPIRLHAKIVDSNLVLEITSKGSEISVAQRSKVFDAFYSLEKGKAGSGLGLYISKSLASAMNGDISVDSPMPGMNIFTVTIPIF